ncbi:hypothetical protein [Aneurinibacillus aneurinilyticus]|uniref:hypothetical protein n=1 Tax=Aneurinibacillus aneurinilyticus TaxID=1391 RepID=UPI0023F2D811|nr:hypothetical protein [Aneurinibacillus aneurinilyticus]MCI1695603.1 hypothetical protein [Aneurinibacillus aneurinilyticus]
MFQLSLFMECQNEREALTVLDDIINTMKNDIVSFDVFENEPYWKVDGWYKTTCNVETTSTIDFQRAENILEKISNKWTWDKGRVSARSSVNNMGAVFSNPKIQFCTCWFEDFE